MKNIYLTLLLLIVYFYSTGQVVKTIRLSSATGEDAYVTDFWDNTNLGTDPDIAAIAWSSGGSPYLGRSYFKFDLSTIPTAAVVSDARLSLYGNPDPLHSPGHSTLSGTNNSFIQRVIGNWDESTITWENKPGSTTTGQVNLAQSISDDQDYLNIDVTNLVQGMVSNPSTNYGFILSLNIETAYRSLNFASGDCTDSTARPKLVITYVDHTSINEYNNTYMAVYPVPSQNLVTIETENSLASGKSIYQLQDITGKVLLSGSVTTTKFSLDLSALSKGIYLISLIDGEQQVNRKVVKE